MLSATEPPHNKRHTQTESEGLEILFQANGQGKKARVEIPMSEKINFRTKSIKREKDGYFIILKGRICQKHINIVNAPIKAERKYIRKILEDLKKYIDSK